MNTIRNFVLTVILGGGVAGCTTAPHENVQNQIKNNNGHVLAKHKTTVAPEFKSPVTTLHVKRPVVSDLEDNRQDKLPDTLIGPFAAANMPIVDLMDTISFESGIAFSFDGNGDSDIKEKVVSLIDPNKVSFAKAIRQISKSANVFYSYENDVLNFETERSFHITVPQVAGASESLSSALQSVGATDVADNTATGGLIFSADPRSLRKVKSLADSWGDNRNMIVYDSYIYEVTLDHSDSSGISLESIEASLGDLAAEASIGSQPVSGGGGLALTLAGVSGDIALEAIASSVQKSGDYKVLSQPTISLASGGSSSIDIGQKQQYVSGLSAEANETTTASSVDVDTIETGLTLKLKGQLSDGMIVTEFDLKLATLLGFEEFDTGDNTLKLPNTAERTVEQTLFARPGDVLVVAGVMTTEIDNSDNRSQIAPVFGSNSNSSKKTELIIVMRPRVIEFKSN